MIIVKDRFQEYIQDNFDTHLLIILHEFLFYSIFIYYYYFGPIQDSQQNFQIIKYILILFFIRYAFHYITVYSIINNKQDTDNIPEQTTYFQFNGKIALFTLFILFLSKGHNNAYFTLAIIFSYALLTSAVKYGYTVDNLITASITYFIFLLQII